jgi:hypothetical protein
MNERPSRAAAPAVRLHIDRVTLVSMPMSAAQSQQFSTSLTLHLQRLAQESPWLTTAAASAAPDAIAPRVYVSTESTPAIIGRDVAVALFEALRDAR